MMEPEKDEEYYNWSRHFVSDPIEFIAINGFDFIEGCILKYVSRYKYKDGLRDLYKARAYLDHLIAREEGKPFTPRFVVSVQHEHPPDGEERKDGQGDTHLV